jgi:hypothetical protein
MNTATLNWERTIIKRRKPRPDEPWERAIGRFSRHLLCLLSSGQWQSWMLMWNDEDVGKAWSSTHPTMEAAKAQAQQIEDGLAEVWTPKAVESEIVRIAGDIAARHGQAFAPTDYDKALSRKEWKDELLVVTKQAPGNVVDIVGAKNTVTAHWIRELRDWAQEGARDNLIVADEAEWLIRAADTFLGMLE